MDKTCELFEQIRKDMDEAGDTPQGRIAMAVLALHERLLALEKWQDVEQTRQMEASEYDRG